MKHQDCFSKTFEKFSSVSRLALSYVDEGVRDEPTELLLKDV